MNLVVRCGPLDPDARSVLLSLRASAATHPTNDMPRRAMVDVRVPGASS